jgi:two-component system NarL family sensor kinase
MIGLCTYPLNSCTADELLDVVRNHQVALTRSAGKWEAIESSNLEERVQSEASPINTDQHRRKEIPESERLQQLLTNLLEHQDQRRRWFAAQLHEVTAQNVSAIANYLTNLQQKTWLSPELRPILAKCRTLCEESIEQILTLSQLLHPLLLDKLGLTACLQRYIQEFVKRTHIPLTFETAPDIGRLSLEIEIHLFRIVQEALLNIQRHSGSRNGIVRLDRKGNRVILQVKDFGRGMPGISTPASAAASTTAGTGILAMQERLRKIGGNLEIRSTNQGTELTAGLQL